MVPAGSSGSLKIVSVTHPAIKSSRASHLGLFDSTLHISFSTSCHHLHTSRQQPPTTPPRQARPSQRSPSIETRGPSSSQAASDSLALTHPVHLRGLLGCHGSVPLAAQTLGIWRLISSLVHIDPWIMSLISARLRSCGVAPFGRM